MTDAIKNSLSASLQPFAKGKVADGLQSLGQRYPCTVAEVISSGIVLVNFEVNAAPFTLPKKKVPVVGSEYVRLPIQVGDKGMCITADARLGGMTGLGSGTPGLTRPGNLSALAFIWLGNTAWSIVDDPDAVVIYGPNGVILRDTAKTNTLTISETTVTLDLGTSMTINTNGNDITISGGGTVTTDGSVVIMGDLTVDGTLSG